MLCDKSDMLVGAKVCELTEDLLWFVCGLYVGMLTSSLTCLRNVWTSHKRPFVPSVGVSDYYVMHRQRAKSVL